MHLYSALGVSVLFNVFVGGYVLTQLTDTAKMEQR